MRRTGYILQPTYRLRGGRAVVQLHGRLEPLDGRAEGEPFLVEDDRFRPYLFARREAVDRLRGEAGIEVRDSELRDLAGQALVQVIADLPAAVARLREKLGTAAALEADVRFAYRFLIDRGIRSGLAIEGQPERLASGVLLFVNPALAPAEVRPRLRFLSLDLETAPDASEIRSAALLGAGVDEVHLVASRPVAGGTIHADEASLLDALRARVAALDPDVLLGWNVVDFDLRVLAERCRSLGVSSDLGRVPGPIGFQEDRGFTRQTRALVPGRMVLDGIALVRDALRLEDYRLETVAQVVLGRGKLLDREAPDAAVEIDRLWREDPEALVAYNREDARLALEILEREGLLTLTVERSLLSGMQLDRVGASIASFDLLYLPELRRRGVAAPSVDSERAALVQGGALLEPVPGLHRNVAVFDFKSLYPSLIRTFNLDPLAHARAGADPITAPNGARFGREDAILPGLIDRFIDARALARARGDRHADQAIKIMLNALFGVLAASACRFFDPAVANAITGFGQQTLRWTRDAFAEQNVRVLYGDTDSVFVEILDRGEVDALRARVEAVIAEKVRREYRVEPRLALAFERFFERLLLPRVRGGRGGSKKRYAGWSEGRLVLVGLEAVRRDWPALARRLQEGMLERLFTDRPVEPFVRELAERLERGELDDELVYVKRVRKGSLDRYTETTPPHVAAARKLAALGRPVGAVVRYVVTRAGPEPVLPGRPLPDGIDRRHYAERVLRPIAEGILGELGSSFDTALGRPQPTQLELL